MSQQQHMFTDFTILRPNIQALIVEAQKARSFSYSPYSQYPVGVCLEDSNGNLHTGCNIEINSFTVGLCAERVAYVKAISTGIKQFQSIAIIGGDDKDALAFPCGACRQFMSEFGNVQVYVTTPQMDKIFTTNLNTLLPYQFNLNTE